MNIRYFPLLLVVLAVLAIATPSHAENSHLYCVNTVCIEFSPQGSNYLLIVTEGDEVMEVTMTEIPSNLDPVPGSGGGGGGGPIVIPHSQKGGGVAVQQGGESTDHYTYSFEGPSGTWIVTITLVFFNGDLVDVNANVTFVPNAGQEK